jgi:hypothetical protein
VLTSSTELRNLRLLERKLDRAHRDPRRGGQDARPRSAARGGARCRCSIMFPQAETVGVLVEDERTGELQVQCQKHAQAGFGGEPARARHDHHSTWCSDRRGVLLGDSAPAAGGEARHPDGRAADLSVGSHYGVVYVESKTAGFRQEDVDLLQTVATQTGLAIHAARVAVQLASEGPPRARPAGGAADPAVSSCRRGAPGGRPGLRGALRAGLPDRRRLLRLHLARRGRTSASAVGDVAGKAISAALYMARLTSELRIARRPGAHAGAALRRVNQEMAKLGDDGMFATLVYCHLRSRDPDAGVHQRRPLRAAAPARRARVPAAGRARTHRRRSASRRISRSARPGCSSTPATCWSW